MHRVLMIAVSISASAGMAHQAAAQDTPMFHNFAAEMAMTQLQNEVLERSLADQERDGPAAAPPASPSAKLTYSPSAERRRANLAHFASVTRQGNPESAAAMDAVFGHTDIIQEFGAALSPYGYSVANVGDAYAAWWMLAWKAANGDTTDPTPGQFSAVQAQAHNALAATPQIAGANDAQKQKFAEALLMQAAMAEALNGMAKDQPELMPQLQQSIRQGALAAGLDLDAMRLTENGFVPH